MKYEDSGEPVDYVADLDAWLRSRRVRISVRWLKRERAFEVSARAENHRGKHHVRTKGVALSQALSSAVDTMNDLIEGARVEQTDMKRFVTHPA